MKKNTSKSVVVKGAPNHSTTPATKTLTTEQQDKFQELEEQIAENLLSSFKLAAALAQIRDEKLYRENYKTFEEYCKKRWEYSRSYCARLADMHGVLTDLKEYEDVQTYPRNELQARVFVPLRKDQRIKLLKTVLNESKTDGNTASEFAKYRKQLWPDQFGAKSKLAKTKDEVIDVKSSVVTMPAIPVISEVVDSAEEVLKCLESKNNKAEPLAIHLRKFIKQAKPVVQWEKVNNN